MFPRQPPERALDQTGDCRGWPVTTVVAWPRDLAHPCHEEPESATQNVLPPDYKSGGPPRQRCLTCTGGSRPLSSLASEPPNDSRSLTEPLTEPLPQASNACRARSRSGWTAVLGRSRAERRRPWRLHQWDWQTGASFAEGEGHDHARRVARCSATAEPQGTLLHRHGPTGAGVRWRHGPPGPTRPAARPRQ